MSANDLCHSRKRRSKGKTVRIRHSTRCCKFPSPRRGDEPRTEQPATDVKSGRRPETETSQKTCHDHTFQAYACGFMGAPLTESPLYIGFINTALHFMPVDTAESRTRKPRKA